MAEKNIQMQVKNSSSYDILYPQTLSGNVKIPSDIATQYGIPQNGQGISTVNEILQKNASNLGAKMDAQVGDIAITARSDLGSEWLFCNGDYVNSSDYPELSKLFPEFDQGKDLQETAPTNQWRFPTLWDGERLICIDKWDTFYDAILYYTDNIDNIISTPNYLWNKKENFVPNYSAQVLKFTYLNGKYIILIKTKETNFFNMSLIIYNNFNDLKNGVYTQTSIYESNQLYSNGYAKVGSVNNIDFIYQNGTYSFLLPLEVFDSSNVNKRGIYIFSSNSLNTAFSCNKILEYNRADSNMTYISTVCSYKYLNGYYIISGRAIKYFPQYTSSPYAGYPMIAYSSSLNSGWVINSDIVGYYLNSEYRAVSNGNIFTDILYYNNKYIVCTNDVKTENNYIPSKSKLFYSSNISNTSWESVDLNINKTYTKSYTNLFLFEIKQRIYIFYGIGYTEVNNGGIFVVYNSGSVFNKNNWTQKRLYGPFRYDSIFKDPNDFEYQSLNIYNILNYEDFIIFATDNKFRNISTGNQAGNYINYFTYLFKEDKFQLPTIELYQNAYIKAE